MAIESSSSVALLYTELNNTVGVKKVNVNFLNAKNVKIDKNVVFVNVELKNTLNLTFFTKLNVFWSLFTAVCFLFVFCCVLCG